MLALAAAGDRGAALRSYADFSRRLARELRVAPSAATRELASRLRREELGTAAAAASGLPLPERLDAVRGGAFAGRQAAGARLHEAFARARSGERCVALVTGEAGIGKTRLLAEFAHAVQGAGALVLYGRCEEEPATPYQPFAEALAPLTVPDVLADGLGGLTAGRPGEPASDPEADRARMFDAVAEWLEEVAARRPLVLALDDLHWADRATLLLLRRLATRPQRVPLLLLGSARDVELRPGHPLTEALAEIRRDRPVVRVALHGLDEAAVATVVEALTGTRPDPAASPRAARANRREPVLRSRAGAARGEGRGRRAPGRRDATSSPHVPAGSRSAHDGCSSSPQSPAPSSTRSSCGRGRASRRRRCWTRSTTPCGRAC